MASRMLCSFLFRVLYCCSCSAATLHLYVTFPSVLTWTSIHLYGSSWFFFRVWLLTLYLRLLYVGQDGILPLTHCAAHDTHTQRCQSKCIGMSLSRCSSESENLFDNDSAKFEYRRILGRPRPTSHPLTLKKAHDTSQKVAVAMSLMSSAPYAARFGPFRSLENIARNHSISICTVARANTLPSHPVTKNELHDQELMDSMTIPKSTNAADELLWKCDDATSLAVC